MAERLGGYGVRELCLKTRRLPPAGCSLLGCYVVGQGKTDLELPFGVGIGIGIGIDSDSDPDFDFETITRSSCPNDPARPAARITTNNVTT
jgi:hypothetical protein